MIERLRILFQWITFFDSKGEFGLKQGRSLQLFSLVTQNLHGDWYSAWGHFISHTCGER